MTPPIRMVSVPVEPTEAMMLAADAVDWNNEDERAAIINMWQSMLTAAPVREEGGAVANACADFQEAIDYFEADVADALAEDSERADLWDREVTVNIDALKTVMSAALATREEAPAEAGEDEIKAAARIIFPESERVKMDREWGGNRNHSRNRWNKALEQARAILALRAQPQAREEAQPVAWRMIGKDGSVISLRSDPFHSGFARMMKADVGCSIQPLYTTPPAPEAEKLRVAVADIVAERQRQVDAEGWSSEHDDEYSMGELERAAGWYALNSVYRGPETLGVADPDCEANKLFAPRHGCGAYQWPWPIEWWKPSDDPRRDLVKAGALIVAAIERLDRQALATLQQEGRA